MVVAAIDAGTTGVRCMIVDKAGKTIALSRRSWTYSTPEYFEVAKEFDPKHFWDLACTVVREAIDIASHKGSMVEGIATTSQRHGMVLLDESGIELHGGPNIDARGSMTQYVIEDEIGEDYHAITGCWPPMMFAPTRIAWFEEEEPEIFESIAHVLPISDWLTFRLSGEYVTEPASASATGFYDIKRDEWSQRVLDALNLEMSILPKISQSGQVVGEITEQASKECNLPKGIPVIQGGTDTHCALLAAQVELSEIGIIAGSTTPVMLVTEDNICDEKMRVWTGRHVIPTQYTIESNATLTGAYLEWIVNLLCERAKKPDLCKKNTFGNLENLLKDVPPGSDETMVGLGPNIMDSTKITNIPLARMMFPQPALPSVKPLNASTLIHAVLENIAYSIRGNCEQLNEMSEVKGIKAIGGMTRSHVWVQMLANILGKEIRTPVQYEGSLVGAAICASVGIGCYSDLEKAGESMVRWNETFLPDERSKDYESYYAKWKEMWCEAS
ncbi:MAG: FGGY-family carbohydrate kinase [Candidatus Thorarchaeota archaeon]